MYSGDLNGFTPIAFTIGGLPAPSAPWHIAHLLLYTSAPWAKAVIVVAATIVITAIAVRIFTGYLLCVFPYVVCLMRQPGPGHQNS